MEKILKKLEEIKLEIKEKRKKLGGENQDVEREIERLRKAFKTYNVSERVERLERKWKMEKGEEEKIT
jgi:hypothetical protein